VLDRLDAQRASRDAASAEETELLEQLIFTGRPMATAEAADKDQPPQKVKTTPAEPARKQKKSAPQTHSTPAKAHQVQINQPAKSKLSAFESELLEAWSQD